MRENKNTMGHLAALLTILIWGTTFISTKILLVDFQPVEILFFRFVMGYLVLLAAWPRRLKVAERGRELTFAAAGLCGICLYYLLENIALTYTMASNVSVIVATAPFFTAFLFWLFMRFEEKPGAGFVLGFLAAMAGIGLISFNGAQMKLNPLGDVLALGALQAARELGLRVPEDLSVVGFDDVEYAVMFQPHLTTIRQPCYALGHTAGEMLLRQIQGGPGGQARYLPHQLIERDSTAQCR